MILYPSNMNNSKYLAQFNFYHLFIVKNFDPIVSTLTIYH